VIIRRRFACLGVPWAGLALGMLIGTGARADSAGVTRLHELKRLQQDIMLSGEQAGEARLDALRLRLPSARQARPAGRGAARPPGGRGRLRSGPPRELREAGRVRARAGAPARAGLAARAAGLLPTNTRVNGGPDQTPAATQSETSVAEVGQRLVAAWNDGDRFQGFGYGYSSNGGRTWTDGGTPLLGGGVALWISDPVVTVDERTGVFYLAGMVITDPTSPRGAADTTLVPRNGIAVARGAFAGDVFQWQATTVARAVRDTLPDKPWIAADSLTGSLYLTYTTFYLRVDGSLADAIEFQRSTDGGLTWSPPVRLSADQEGGLVQGSRPAVGPGGELQVVWKSIDTTTVAGGLDPFRARRSLDGGATFGPSQIVARAFTNFCSGAPGFNRGFGLGFPAIAVDRSAGPHRGRAYVAWEEPLDFYDDPIGTLPDVAEREPDGDPASATTFELGATLRGAIDPPREMDWFRFHGLQGQTAIVYMDSVAPTLDVALRLVCGDGQTQLAYSAPLIVRPRVLVYTLPEAGDYYLSVAPIEDSTGVYRIITGLARRGAERGRDHRDVFVSWSDDGQAWSEPTRVNDGPPWFDNWLPEITVTPEGKVFVLWYDWRDSDPGTCGGVSSVYLARSDDGAATWASLGPVTSVRTAWSEVASNLSPNQGDYLGIVGDENAIHPFWADGRDGDPNVYTAVWPLPATAERVVALEPAAGPRGPVLRWQSPENVPFVGTIYRRAAWSDWVALGTGRADATGRLSFTDATAEREVRYAYRLGIPTSEGEATVGELEFQWSGAGPLRLAIENLRPNPTGGPIGVWFSRPSDDPVTFELFDLGGRRWLSRTVGSGYGLRGLVELDLESLPAGLYVVRLTQGGVSVSAKAAVLR
jgi:hypothetical protein